ncbi:Synaptonemal complex protein 2-like [Triplophysa tibetana]|uniref:Synaptonemal complex protein 2-like n=1 Tax=Triplophysa tibetana TaxID=1572043 RepID=A0A5A9N4Q8_9TELE|nr:Synaptonemal complex protein 2-like [Triplophysa tibetana]
MTVIEEKSCVTLADRLDEVVTTELRRNGHKNVALILRALEHVIIKDEECIHKLVNHGLVVKMLNWFERVSEHLKEQQKPTKIAIKLIEVFYEVSMSLCQMTSAGSYKILDVFLLRFGAVVLDHEAPFSLRLEAIRTINSMLDSSPKDIRKRLCQSDDHIGLLVFSFPCIRVFLDSTELFKPDDEFLTQFWVDFNIGTSTISFFVNDPQNTLWELIHLCKDAISTYTLQERDEQEILTVNMMNPISNGKITGQKVEIIFSSDPNIQTALTRVFEEKLQPAPKRMRMMDSSEEFIRRDTPQIDYSRKRSRSKGKLREPYGDLKRDQLLPRLKPKRLFKSMSLEDAAERVTKVLEDESEEELGAGVRAAFNSFKTQLKAHFSSRYKRIEARSMQSLTDCQRNVTTLLGTVHSQRLLHLDHFQNSVVQQLECLEQDCLSLKAIEKETSNFWQSESNTVRAFCDRQQKRLVSLTVPQESAVASYGRSENQEAKVSLLADLEDSQCHSEQSNAEDLSS